MPRKSKQASKPIASEDSQEVSESQKKHYSKLGYKPYLSHSGKIKWLSFEQHTYEMIKYNKPKSFFPSKRRRPKGPKVIKLSRMWLRSLLSNWFLILVLLCIIYLIINLQPIMFYLANLHL